VATTATPGSAVRTDSERREVARFSATERALHWLHACAFFGMLATGLVLYLPSLSVAVGNRPVVKALHLGIAIGWLLAVALVAVLGRRRALRRTIAELERFDRDDRDWLLGRHAPQGRFNAGQKIHAILQAAIATLFVFSGVLLWLGERDTRFRLAGTVRLHDMLMFAAVALVVGHLWLALVWPATRPALQGMVRGTVPTGWARRHHAKWEPSAPSPAVRSAPSRAELAVAALLVGLAVAAALVVVVPELR
jgi:formate dehydrogenase subunit gamma